MASRAVKRPSDELPPQDFEAEQATLGAMLMDHQAALRAMTIVAAEDFYREAHRDISAAIEAVEAAGQPIDLVSVGAELRRQGQLEACGGGEYLTVLMDQVPTTAHVMRYAAIVRKTAILRRTIRWSREFQEEAYAQPDDLADFMGRACEGLRALVDQSVDADGIGYASADAAAAYLGAITWTWLPWLPDGFLTLLVGESGIGKSKLAMRLVESVVRPRSWPDGQSEPAEARAALYVCTEGAQAMHVQRMKAANLPMDRVFLPGQYGDQRLALDRPSTLALVRRVVERERLGIVVLDSLRAGMSGDENSSEFGGKLAPWADLARDAAIPVVIVHHANKAQEEQMMTLSRVRGSSAITALPRSIIGLDQPDRLSSTVRVQHLKSSLERMAEPFGLELTETGCDGAPLPKAPRADTSVAAAEEFLERFLAKGPRPVAEIEAAAAADCISRATLHRARGRLNLESRRNPRDQHGKLWCLPEPH